MRVLSLFDGIATGRLALQMAGIPVDLYLASEIDADTKTIARSNWPDMVHLAPIEKVVAADLPPIDLVIGGSPCQGFSRAGAGKNFDDPRSRLFFQFARIWDEVRAINPKAKFLLENVIMKKEWEGVISERMGVEPVHINSRAYSAQSRPRAYWSNIADLTPLAKADSTGPLLSDIIDRTVDTSSFEEIGGILFGPKISEGSKKLVSKTADGIIVRQATARGYIEGHDGDGLSLAFPGSKTRRGRVIKGKSQTLTCACDVCVFYDNIIRHYTIEELEQLQGLPPGYTAAAQYQVRKRAIGNGWTATVIAEIFKELRRKEGTDGQNHPRDPAPEL